MRKMVAKFYCHRTHLIAILFLDYNGKVTVECSVHFAHTQQFSSNANLTLITN